MNVERTVTPAEVDSFVEKYVTWAKSLSGRERALATALVDLRRQDDVGGYMTPAEAAAYQAAREKAKKAQNLVQPITEAAQKAAQQIIANLTR